MVDFLARLFAGEEDNLYPYGIDPVVLRCGSFCRPGFVPTAPGARRVQNTLRAHTFLWGPGPDQIRRTSVLYDAGVTESMSSYYNTSDPLDMSPTGTPYGFHWRKLK